VPDINPRFEECADYRRAVRELCAQFGSEYWQSVDQKAEYPEAFVKALTDAGWLAALIPKNTGAAASR
jgi:acyl-CoA dehydrogenase